MKISPRFVVLVALFVTCLITANVIAVKLVSFGFVVVPAAIFVFPISYIFGDVLTEVYGFAWARRVIWLGFGCNLVFVFFAWLGQVLPPATFWNGQQSYVTILGSAPRLLLASFTGYLVGEFANSFILSKVKVLTRGRWLWTRTISSTIVGEGLDTALFIIIAFFGSPAFMPAIILYHWTAKVALEVAATPLTYVVVAWLKKAESVDAYDSSTSFTPFSVKVA
jgi:queuosine precursor transporter